MKYDGVSYLLKNEDDEELIKAIEKLLEILIKLCGQGTDR